MPSIPQKADNKSNGFMKVPHWLSDGLMCTDLRGGEIRIIIAVARTTLGYHAESAPCSQTQLVRLTGLALRTVKRYRRALIERHIIAAERRGPGRKNADILTINPRTEEWVSPLVRRGEP